MRERAVQRKLWSMNTATDNTEILAIHNFWFGEPARDAATLIAKFGRWYQGGAELDHEIRIRFSATVEEALNGRLTHWTSDLQGQLALIVLLDQFARNLYRDTPRAYAGDAQAQRLALALIERGLHRSVGLEQRLFCIMPLVHSESLELHERAVELAEAFVPDAPPELQTPWRFGAQRTAHYRSVIARFGRFPHRNAILGRSSTLDELEFLLEEIGKGVAARSGGSSARRRSAEKS